MCLRTPAVSIKSPVLGLKWGLWVFRKSQKISTASDQYFLSYVKKLQGGGSNCPPPAGIGLNWLLQVYDDEKRKGGQARRVYGGQLGTWMYPIRAYKWLGAMSMMFSVCKAPRLHSSISEKFLYSTFLSLRPKHPLGSWILVNPILRINKARGRMNVLPDNNPWQININPFNTKLSQ